MHKSLLVCLLFISMNCSAKMHPRFKAIAFDYFVIFDPNSVVPAVEKVFPGAGIEFTKTWRAKQFEYCFLRTITNRHADFYKVTADALEYTAQLMHMQLTNRSRDNLMKAFLELKPWPDAINALRKLKSEGVRVITITNFSPEMLKANADAAGITPLFDILLSTEENHTFKPDTLAYSAGLQKLHLSKEEVVFAAFGGWDAYGAKNFGYTTYWVNRMGLPAEVLDAVPDKISNDLKGLLDFVLGEN